MLPTCATQTSPVTPERVQKSKRRDKIYRCYHFLKLTRCYHLMKYVSWIHICLCSAFSKRAFYFIFVLFYERVYCLACSTRREAQAGVNGLIWQQSNSTMNKIYETTIVYFDFDTIIVDNKPACDLIDCLQ